MDRCGACGCPKSVHSDTDTIRGSHCHSCLECDGFTTERPVCDRCGADTHDDFAPEASCIRVLRGRLDATVERIEILERERMEKRAKEPPFDDSPGGLDDPRQR